MPSNYYYNNQHCPNSLFLSAANYPKSEKFANFHVKIEVIADLDGVKQPGISHRDNLDECGECNGTKRYCWKGRNCIENCISPIITSHESL